MKVLFTGGTGFLGRNLVGELSKFCDVYAPSRAELNLLNREEVENCLLENTYDVIIHAAIPNLLPGKQDSENTLFKDSIKAFINLVSLKKHYTKLIYFGSGAEFDKSRDIVQVKESDFSKYVPESDYGLSKYVMNQIARNDKDIINLRIFGCYGSTDADFKFFQSVIRDINEGRDIVIKQDCYFDYICVEDIMPVLKYFIENNNSYSDYNVCSGNRYLLSDLAKLVIQMIPDCTSKIRIMTEGYNKEYTANNQRLLDEMKDFHFTSIEEGIKAYIERELK